MTLSEYRKTQSWQGAIAIGPALINLAEALPASEEMGLSFQLRQLMVEVPAAVANDLMRGTEARHKAVLRLVAAIELIDKVYPALDTASVRTSVDQLADRLTGLAFQEELTPGQASAAPAPAPAPMPREEVGEPAGVPVLEGSAPAEPAAPVEPAMPAEAPEQPDASAAEPTHINVQAE